MAATTTATTAATTTMLQHPGGPPPLLLPSTPSLGPVFFRLPRYGPSSPSELPGSSLGEGGVGGKDGPEDSSSVVWWPGVLERTPWSHGCASSDEATADAEEKPLLGWCLDMGWAERLRMTEHQIRQATTSGVSIAVAGSSSASPLLLPSVPTDFLTVRLLGWHRPSQARHYVSDVASECLPWEPGSVDKAWAALQRTSRPSRVWKRFKTGIRKATNLVVLQQDGKGKGNGEGKVVGTKDAPPGNSNHPSTATAHHSAAPPPHLLPTSSHLRRTRVSIDVADDGVAVGKEVAAATPTPAAPAPPLLPINTPAPPQAPDRNGSSTLGGNDPDGTASAPVDDNLTAPLLEEVTTDPSSTAAFPDHENNNHDSDPPPPPVFGPSIAPHDAWSIVWGKLEYSGWSCRYDFQTNTNRYAQPGKSSFSKTGAQSGRDYFDNLANLQEYVQEHYGWVGPDHDDNNNNNLNNHNEDGDDSDYMDDGNHSDCEGEEEDDDCAEEVEKETGADTVASPSTTTAAGSPVSHSSDDSFFGWSGASSPDSRGNDDRYVFRILLSKLKARGWKYKRGKGLQNFLYVPPADALRRDPTLPAHLDSEEAVITYCKAHDEARGYGLRRPIPQDQNRSRAPTHQPKQLPKKKAAQPAKKHPPPTKKTAPPASMPQPTKTSTGKETEEDASTRKRGWTSTADTDGSKPAGMGATAKQKKKARRNQYSSEAWYKTNPVPSDDDMWPHLEALGFRRTPRGYHLPAAYNSHGMSKDPPRDDVGNVAFPTLAHVRKFLAKYGTVPEPKKTLKKNDQIDLRRWIAFANVPVTPAKSVWRLSDLSPTLTDKQLKALMIDHGFHTVGGRLYLPGADAVARGNDRKRNVHYFEETDAESLLRPYLRGAWAVVHIKGGGDADNARGQRRGAATDPASVVPLAVHVTPLVAIDPRKTLQLRLWAATTPHDLPEFHGWPCEAELQALLDYDLAAQEADLLSSGDSSDEGSDSDDGADSTSPFLGEKKSVIPDIADDTRSIGRESTASEVPTSARSSMSGPLSDWECVWPALEEHFGFKEVAGGYTHAEFGGKIMTTHEDLAKCLCKFGIPRYHERKGGMDKAVRALLLRWVTRAFVPDDETTDGDDDVDAFPTSERCRALLRRLGWEWLDGTFFAPWSNGDNRTHRVEGVHKFTGEDKLRVFLRSSDVLGNHVQLSDSDLRAVRVWAANVDAPIPTFCQATFLGRDGSNGPGARGRSGSRRTQGPSLEAVIREWANSIPSWKPTPKVPTPYRDRETRIVSIGKPSPMGKGVHLRPGHVEHTSTASISVLVGTHPIHDDAPTAWMTQYDNDPLLMDYGFDGDGTSTLEPEEPALEGELGMTSAPPAMGHKPGEECEPEPNTDDDENNADEYHDAYQAANDFLTQKHQSCQEDSDAECGDDQRSSASKDY